MRVFVDTNIFVASLTNEPERGVAATNFLNQDHEFLTSILNMMELRSVLMKKKQIEQSRVEGVIDDITEHTQAYIPDEEDFMRAYEMQRETVLYTMDCVLLALANDIGATFVTFDGEILAHGGKKPEELA